MFNILPITLFIGNLQINQKPRARLLNNLEFLAIFQIFKSFLEEKE